jgi:acetoin utilization protein AcuB
MARRKHWNGGMSKHIPSIQRYMSTTPHTVGPQQAIAVARELMSKHEVRHLPVLDGAKPVGLVSARDIAVVEGLAGSDPRAMKVEDVMTQVPYLVGPDAPLDEVCREMARHKYGSALVVQNQKCVGIFTTVDACRALADLLHGRLSN